MEKPNETDVAATVLVFSKLIPFFPQDDMAQAVIVREFLSFIRTKEQLVWFEKICISKISKYEGIPYFRALFCTRFDPADRQQATVIFTGYSEGDVEQDFLTRQREEDVKRLEFYHRDYQRALSAGEITNEPLQLPAPAEMPAPSEEDRRIARVEAPEWLRLTEGLPPRLDDSWASSPDWLRKDQGMPTRADIKQVEKELRTAPRRYRTPEENEAIRKDVERKLAEMNA